MFQLSRRLQCRFMTSRRHRQRCNLKSLISRNLFSYYFFTLFEAFRRQNVCSLIVLTDFSHVFGRFFFYSILIILPCNAVILMLLALVPMTAALTFVLLIFALMQLVVIFFYHYRIALLSARFHRPVKNFIGYFCVHEPISSQSCTINSSCVVNTRLREQLKMVFYVEAFHTRRPYSMTYGGWGNITVNSFKKVNNIWQFLRNVFLTCLILFLQQTFYYIKLLFFAYKLVAQLNNQLF